MLAKPKLEQPNAHGVIYGINYDLHVRHLEQRLHWLDPHGYDQNRQHAAVLAQVRGTSLIVELANKIREVEAR
ncbi:hypothetical protein GCM10009526_23810 [Glutamicibacter creatinolyticus]